MATPKLAHLKQQLLLLGGFLALACLMMWPLPLHLGSHVIKAMYFWDAYTNEMALSARVDNVLGTGPGGIYDSYFFAPIPNSIVFNESLFGLALLYAPFHLVTHDPLLSYNLTLLSSFVLSQYFTYLLVRRLTGNAMIGIVSGFAFSLSPYATFEMGRIQLVATQWIPLCFYFLHRASSERRLRDAVGVYASYLLQLGTCLYYAMFMLPLLGLLCVLWFAPRPPTWKFLKHTMVAGVVAGAVAVGMVYPYFSARNNFNLQRAESFAAAFDGKLSFFGYVHDTNLTLTGMHHRSWKGGAHEEIAFPGFTIAMLCMVALLLPVIRHARRTGLRNVGIYLGMVAGSWTLAAIVSVLGHSMLGGLLVLLLAHEFSRRRRILSPYPPALRVQLWWLTLSVVLFLGLEPAIIDDKPIHGLYYYLHTYLPGMDGIRKVSRQACMTTFAFTLLAGFGGQMLLDAIKPRLARSLLTAALLCLSVLEFRTFPHPISPLWSASTVPAAYHYIAAQKGTRPVAVTPAYFGMSRFRNERGLALHNYLALFHRRRTANGKSSFIPPVTHLLHQALAALPQPRATRVLNMLDVEYLLVHGEDLPLGKRTKLINGLNADKAHFEHVFGEGDIHVYRVLRQSDPTLTLLPTPTVPATAYKLPRTSIAGVVASIPFKVERAIDGNINTGWTTKRFMQVGDFFEFKLTSPQRVGMVEFDNQNEKTDFPSAYRVEVAMGDAPLQTVAHRPHLQLFRDQVYHPKGFSFRVPLPGAPLADRIRVTALEPVPGRYYTIDEATLWVMPTKGSSHGN